MFKAGAEVEIITCADNPRAAGKKGRIVDEVPPGELTGGRWTVNKIGIFTAPVLCHAHELRATGR
ncbi:hypothetical protein [Streptomyces sp. A1136]|uniref:hypothetical protein n=1 Tax=Streptomyces sp. A1136 TaxID=2563102 RepID=UPI00109EB16B|nr:hypothetical protein [Streptomyces sp. A1136]THA53219.1 hypothetical protein E6R62_19190 [Streptomyces sp. A1136]